MIMFSHEIEAGNKVILVKKKKNNNNNKKKKDPKTLSISHFSKNLKGFDKYCV